MTTPEELIELKKERENLRVTKVTLIKNLVEVKKKLEIINAQIGRALKPGVAKMVRSTKGSINLKFKQQKPSANIKESNGGKKIIQKKL